MTRDFHDGDGRNARQVHVRRTAPSRRVGLYQIAFFDQMCFLFSVLDV